MEVKVAYDTVTRPRPEETRPQGTVTTTGNRDLADSRGFFQVVLRSP